MRMLVEIKTSRIGEITLPYTKVGKSCRQSTVASFSSINIVNLCFNVIRETKILAVISEYRDHYFLCINISVNCLIKLDNSRAVDARLLYFTHFRPS